MGYQFTETVHVNYVAKVQANVISAAIVVPADKFERQIFQFNFMRAAVLAGYLLYFELLP